MVQDIECEQYFKRHELQHRINQDLRLLESQQQELRLKAEALLFELEGRTAKLKREQQEVEVLEVQYQEREQELDDLESRIKYINKLLCGGSFVLDEELRQQNIYGHRVADPDYIQSILCI